MRFTKILMATSAVIALSTAHQVMADTPHNDSLKTSNDFTYPNVLDTRGNCVRTQWKNGSDVCAPEVAQAPAPVKEPAPIMPAQLSKEETIVYFEFDKSNLIGSQAAKLDVIARALQNAEKIVDAKVVGYADPIGTNDYNLSLSQRRVDTVQSYLQGKGVTNSEAVDVRAMGETNAFASCNGLRGDNLIKCFRENRRVEVLFEYK